MNYCKYCGKDISNLKSYQKGGHVSSCKLNPNRDNINYKQTQNRNINKRKSNPIIKLKLNCLNCDKEYEINVIESYYKRYQYKKCCSKVCAKSYSSKHNNYDRNKLSNCKICNENILTNNKRVNVYCDNCRRNLRNKIFKNDKWICKKCDEEKCQRPQICRKFSKNNVFEKYLGFDTNKKGTKYFYDEFDRIVKKLKNDYFDNELSLSDIGKKYKINFQTLSNIFKKIGIKTRTLSESEHVAIKNGKMNYENTNPYPYKNGYHITWDGRKIHYRSSYEKDYYKKLDEQKIYYETEKLRLFYFDTEKNKRRIAIPDIFIPSENLIIEIKSFWTHNEKNWKDRLKTYKKLKYKVKLVIGESRKNIKEINY